MTYNGTANLASPTSVLAVNLATTAVDGTILSADSEAITDTSNASAPFLLDQDLDTVERIDPTTWMVDGTWSVPPVGDGGTADPYAISVATETQVYVISYNKNGIDVFDLTKGADGGAPTTTISLASLLQAGDMDGAVEATAAAYVASTKRLYVVLGNLNLNNTLDYMGNYDTICASTTSTVIAIDTTTNALVSLGGTAPGGGITLKGYDPSGAQGLVYDAASSRLLVLEAGCNPAPTADAGAPGAVQQRGVEAVDLTSNTSTILLDASSQGFPGSFVYIDAHDAVVSFGYPVATAYRWDPTTSTLGAALPNAPNVFDYDGAGNLVGASLNYGDGGAPTTTIFSMSIASGTASTLQASPVALGTYAFISSVGVWPRP